VHKNLYSHFFIDVSMISSNDLHLVLSGSKRQQISGFHHVPLHVHIRSVKEIRSS